MRYWNLLPDLERSPLVSVVGRTYSSKLQDSIYSCTAMVEQKLPQENLVAMALEFNRVVMVGDYGINPTRWNKVMRKLEQKGWKYNVVNTEYDSSTLYGANVIQTVEEIRHFVPLILLMDTTQKQHWIEMISYRMEVWGDVQLIWLEQGCAISQNDRNDFHAYGWSYVENLDFVEVLENSKSKSSPPTP